MTLATTDARTVFLGELADRIEARFGTGVLRVGIDGVDGAGKTSLADEVAGELRGRGVVTIRAGIDGFHNPRAVRYRLGRDSPGGFFRDTTNIALLRQALLDPLSPGGRGRYRERAFDHRSDSVLDVEEKVATMPCVLLFDGIFLHRPELRPYWDLSVFLDVPFAQSYARMAQRDGSDPSPQAASNQRYYEGQKLYLAACRPQDVADILVDYEALDAPRILRG
jgi:uridine kinase